MVIVLFWGTVYDIGFTWVYHIRISSASFEMLLPLLGWLCTVKNRCLVPCMAGCYQTISTNPLIRRSYMRTVYLLYIYNIIFLHNIVYIYNTFYYLYNYIYMYVYCINIYIKNIISPWCSHICWGPGNREKNPRTFRVFAEELGWVAKDEQCEHQDFRCPGWIIHRSPAFLISLLWPLVTRG